MFLQYSITRRHAFLQYLVIFLCLCNIGMFFLFSCNILAPDGMHSCNIWIYFYVLAKFWYFSFIFLQYFVTRRHALLQYLDFFDVLLKYNQLHRYAVRSCNISIFLMFLHYFISSRCTIAPICSALLQYIDIFLCACNILSAEDSHCIGISWNILIFL